MILTFFIIILCIAGIIVPIAVIQNKKYIRQMEVIAFEYHSDVANSVNKHAVVRELLFLKSKIKFEKRAIEHARDILDSI